MQLQAAPDFENASDDSQRQAARVVAGRCSSAEECRELFAILGINIQKLFPDRQLKPIGHGQEVQKDMNTAYLR